MPVPFLFDLSSISHAVTSDERVDIPNTPVMASSSTEALEQLIDVVASLRDPDKGCPWDLKQSHASLAPYVLEEAHEVADAIRHGDDRQLKEELGDLLLQVVLHAQIPIRRGAMPQGV